MQRACELLKTERCSLFLVDAAKQELVTRFHGGLDRSISIPITRGVVGHTATTGEIVNIIDAYSDARFDKGIDLSTGFTTRTLLTVPIYNNRGEIAGVTEMINRIDGSAFDDDDIRMMVAFNVFCGISLDNAKLYTTLLDLTRQLRGFVELSSALNKTRSIRDVIDGILTNAMMVIQASQATIFLCDRDTDQLAPFVHIGAALSHGAHLAEAVRSSKTAMLFEREPEPTCGFPLTTGDREVLGVMELSCNWRIMPEDLKLLDCFAVFAAVSLERGELQDVMRFGTVERELKKFMSDAERGESAVPERLALSDATIFTVNFDAPQWEGVGYFKVLFALFTRFDLLVESHVTSECFFRFIVSISTTYNKVPYHNWRHAVDVTQFLTYEILTAKLDAVLPKFELFGLLVAAVCHDANHDGFTNVYNVKAETPLGILFKNQSVMETHHCEVAIGCMAHQECNILASLHGAEFKKMWTLIIQLILVTDMAKHFAFLKDANTKMDDGPLNMEEPNDRLVVLQLILKCGDVSNVSRPFELADKWCDVLCEEFFRQGDLEMAQGMEYTSPLNDREHLDKPKSQIGFYTFVCLPLYQTCARALPPLEVNCQQIGENLAVWKAAAAAKAEAQ
jgi:GAF domain-containing protein